MRALRVLCSVASAANWRKQGVSALFTYIPHMPTHDIKNNKAPHDVQGFIILVAGADCILTPSFQFSA